MDISFLRLYRYTLSTPIGEFVMLIDENGAVRLSNWTDHEEEAICRLRRAYEPREILIEYAQLVPSSDDDDDHNRKDMHGRVVRQMGLYFSYISSLDNTVSIGEDGGDITDQTHQQKLQSFLDSIHVKCPPSTPFMQVVWATLRELRVGEMTTYGELATRCQRPNASRAVGQAMRRNLLCVLLPCHRVVGASHMLTGFSSGIWRKLWLLRHEHVSFIAKELKHVEFVRGTLHKRSREQ